MATVAEKTILDPASPGKWLEQGFEAMFALIGALLWDAVTCPFKRRTGGSPVCAGEPPALRCPDAVALE